MIYMYSRTASESSCQKGGVNVMAARFRLEVERHMGFWVNLCLCKEVPQITKDFHSVGQLAYVFVYNSRLL